MRLYGREGAARGVETGGSEGGTKGRGGRLALAAVGLIAAGWLYSAAGGELREALPAWAGGEESETVEAAARRYADAFDYRGSDGGEYGAQIDRVVTEGYERSPGGRLRQETVRWLAENDATWEQAVELMDYRVTARTDREATGTATYDVTSRVEGHEPYHRVQSNEVRFVREGGRWLAAWAGDPRLAEGEARSDGTAGGDAKTGGTDADGAVGGSAVASESSSGQTMGKLRREEEYARVEEAVRRFSEAYDFSGTSAAAYAAQIEPYVTDGFWRSPRGAQNLEDMREIEDAGETFSQQAELVAWEPTEVGTEEASGYATRSFTGSLGGESGGYTIRHELRLTKEDGTWRIDWAGDEPEGRHGP